jgi:WD40 repeat protein/DNA-binding SARP family transcriptional activator
MRFLVLGPLEVLGDDGGSLSIAGSKERTILADLIAHAGLVVSVDSLIDELWGDQPPRTAEKTIGSYVSRIRRALEAGLAAGTPRDVIIARSDGYELLEGAHAIDATDFERLAEEGRRLLVAGDMKGAASTLTAALELWRGDAYQGLRYTGFGAAEGDRLDELRRAAVEDSVDARLSLGADGSLVAELEGLVREAPLRERRWGQLMLVLYRTGRQAEALDAYRRAREILVNELGIEPGPDLQQIHEAILKQDSALGQGVALPSARPEVCPYKGLARFERADANFFFGRERSITEGIARLVSGSFLGLIGASGSGKSSLLRAGLVHALEAGALPGSDRWAYAIMRPGPHPLESLTLALGGSVADSSEHADARRELRSLATSSEDGRFVLVVDQFEETFTICDDDEERTQFLDAITEPALMRDGRVTLLLAMRADQYGRCAEHSGLASLLATSQLLVGPMSSNELRSAIELPAQRAGLRVEPELTDALVGDVTGRPGSLPLLSTALLELWQRRSDNVLQFAEYQRSGGVHGAVARLADEAYSRLDFDEQASARRILMRLAGPGRGDEVVGRRASLSEVDLENDPNGSRAVAVLADARLVTVSKDSIEVAHEALFREWPRLRDWLEEDAEGRRLHQNLAEATIAWIDGGRDVGDLYRGARWAAALDWSETHEPDLNAGEREFLAASREMVEGEAARSRRTNRRLRSLLAGVAVLLVLSLIVGNVALKQRDRARAAADIADARQLAARSLTEEDLVVSLLLARQAVEMYDSPETRSALLTALERDPAAIAVMHVSGSAIGDPTQWLSLSPDGLVLAAGGARPSVEFFDARTYQRIGEVDVGSTTTSADFSSDGTVLAVAASEQGIVAIDVKGLAVRTRIATKGTVGTIRFDPQGAGFVTGETIGDQGVLVPRDVATLQPNGAPIEVEGGSITAMAFSADGRTLATTSNGSQPGRTVLWEMPGLRRIRGYRVTGADVALSADGTRVALAGGFAAWARDIDGHVVLLDSRTGRELISREAAPQVASEVGSLNGVEFSSDGRSVVATSHDGKMLIWDARSAAIEDAFDDPAGLPTRAPEVSPDGTSAFTIDSDGNVVAWDLDGGRRVGQSFVAGSGAPWWGPWFAVTPDGTTIAEPQQECADPSRCYGSSVRLIDVSTLRSVGVIPYDHYGTLFPQGLAFSPDGRTLAVTSFAGYVQLWDVDTDEPQGPPFRPHGDEVDFWAMPAFSPDGYMLATAGVPSRDPQKHGGVVYLWDVATHRLITRLPRQRDAVNTVNFSPDGTLLVVCTGLQGGEGDALVWNVRDGRVEEVIHDNDSGIYAADISNDGKALLTGAGSSSVRLWNLASGDPIGPAFNGLASTAQSVDLSPDGKTLVATDASGNVVMWDVTTGTILGLPFPGPEPLKVTAAAFAPDKRHLLVVSVTGDGWVWDIDPSSWDARACQIAGRSLTRTEWEKFLPSRPYDATCGS